MSKKLFLMAMDKRYGDEWIRASAWLTVGPEPREEDTPDYKVYIVGEFTGDQQAFKAWGENQPDVYNKQ